MLVFEVKMNGEKVCRAGIDEPGVISAILTWVMGDGLHIPLGKEELYFDVGGLRSATHEYPRWLYAKIKRGDRINIRIVESKTADAPRQSPAPPAKAIRKDEDRQKRYVKRMAKSWGWTIEVPKSTKNVTRLSKSKSKPKNVKRRRTRTVAKSARRRPK